LLVIWWEKSEVEKPGMCVAFICQQHALSV
jgi:hypothetical protein